MKKKIMALFIIGLFVLMGSVQSVQLKSEPRSREDTLIATFDGSMSAPTEGEVDVTGSVVFMQRLKGVKIEIHPVGREYYFVLFQLTRGQRFWIGRQIFRDHSESVMAAFSFLRTLEEVRDLRQRHPDHQYFSGGIKTESVFYQIRGEINWMI